MMKSQPKDDFMPRCIILFWMMEVRHFTLGVQMPQWRAWGFAVQEHEMWKQAFGWKGASLTNLGWMNWEFEGRGSR